MKTNPDDDAFPQPIMESTTRGLSKLEIFTLAAMQGLCANPVYVGPAMKEQMCQERIAGDAVSHARATLAALRDWGD